MTEPLDLDHLRQWIGKTTEATDIVTAQLVKGLRATLFQEIGEPRAGDAAPWTTHWCLGQPVFPMSMLGPDGHPTRGGFLPPVPLPRRMWAGGELAFLDSLRVGDEVKRSSRIADVTMKTGSTGALCFVAVEHTITTPRGVAIRERQDIVYRDLSTAQPATSGKPAPPPPVAKHRESHMADAVLLFRYSALTFNGHRIHYDRRYVTEVEGYPGLVVHGPLIATLLLDLLRRERPTATVARFDFKAVSPLFDLHPFELCGRPDGERGFALWARNHEGGLAMQATAEVA
jgi:3-methylfumaryl-CoA hydratase